jgi:hypothetical protein
MTLKDIMQTQIKDRADFLRERPEYRKATPGTMSSTIHEAMRIKAWSPDWYHWFRFSVATEKPSCQFYWAGKGDDPDELQRVLHTGISTSLRIGAIELGRSSNRRVRHVVKVAAGSRDPTSVPKSRGRRREVGRCCADRSNTVRACVGGVG